MDKAFTFAREARLSSVKADITTLAVGAIVNAANKDLAGGGGVDGAIHRAAGPGLAEACAAIRAARHPGSACPTGSAVATPGFRLPAPWVIHTAGPVWGRHRDAEGLLAACYRGSLELAASLGVDSIAFPSISTGVYGFPKERAARIAVETCVAWLTVAARSVAARGGADTNGGSPAGMRILFVCFDGENLELYRGLAG